MENKNTKVQYESPVMQQSQLMTQRNQVLCASGEGTQMIGYTENLGDGGAIFY